MKWVPGSSCEQRRITFGKSRITCKKRLITCKKRLITWYMEWEQVVYGEKWRMSLLRISFFSFQKRHTVLFKRHPRLLSQDTVSLFKSIFPENRSLLYKNMSLFIKPTFHLQIYVLFLLSQDTVSFLKCIFQEVGLFCARTRDVCAANSRWYICLFS